MYAFHLFAGPLTSTLVNLLGIRKVAIIGTFVASVSFALSVIAPSIDVLIVTYGVLGGKYYPKFPGQIFNSIIYLM